MYIAIKTSKGWCDQEWGAVYQGFNKQYHWVIHKDWIVTIRGRTFFDKWNFTSGGFWVKQCIQDETSIFIPEAPITVEIPDDF